MLASKTVVGLFNNQVEADRVVADLHAAGISGGSIKTVNRRELEAHEMTLSKESRAESGAGLLSLLNRLFGMEHHRTLDHDSTIYSDLIRNGGVLVAVNTDTQRADQAATIMRRYTGAETSGRALREEEIRTAPAPVAPIASQRRDLGSDLKMQEREEKRIPAPVVSPIASRRDLGSNLKEDLGADIKEEEATIPIVEEELRVGKRKVQRGPVRVVKHVSETPIEESVQLRDETVTVERRTVDRLASEEDLRGFTESKVEMIETTEEPVVSKEAHVVEEITITKHAKDHVEKIRDKVRKTEVDIEGIGAEKLGDSDFRKNFQARFASGNRKYADYAPAYELGSSLAADERFKKSDWASMQGEARRLWENKKSGSWNDYADAVRQGWEIRRGNRAA